MALSHLNEIAHRLYTPKRFLCLLSLLRGPLHMCITVSPTDPIDFDIDIDIGMTLHSFTNVKPLCIMGEKMLLGPQHVLTPGHVMQPLTSYSDTQSKLCVTCKSLCPARLIMTHEVYVTFIKFRHRTSVMFG